MPLLRRALLIAGACCAGWALFSPGPGPFPYAWGAFLAAGLIAYLLLPRTRRSSEFIAYKCAAWVGLDIFGALLLGALFGLPWLIFGDRVLDAELNTLTFIIWACACLCLLIHRRACVLETHAFRIVDGGVQWWRNSTMQEIRSADVLYHKRTSKPGAVLQVLQLVGSAARLARSGGSTRSKASGTDRLEIEMRDDRKLTIIVQELREEDAERLERAIAGDPVDDPPDPE